MKLPLVFILLTVRIDAMGVGLILPVMPDLIREVQGRKDHCRLNAAPMAEADAWRQRYRVFWNDKLDALEQALKDGD